MKRKKGSITIFSLLSLLLITATLFALLEGTRFQEMKRFAILQTEAGIESVFANYNTCLWKNYHLLGADSSSMHAVLEHTLNGRAGEGIHLLQFDPTEIEFDEYTRITDGNGTVFIAGVATYMKENFGYEAIKELYSQYEAVKSILDSNQMDLSDIEMALDEINTAEVTEKQTSVGTSGVDDADAQINVKEILETIKRWQQFGILELVIEDTEQLSNSQVDLQNSLLERDLENGKNSLEYQTTWVDRILLQQYLLTYMSYYTKAKENRALSYELEYLIGKKEKDVENLKIVASKLLAIREASNFLYLLSNTEKMKQVETAALLLAGQTGNPVFIEIVKLGLITAWALAESVFDVRALLAGKRIALLKSEESWTLELADLTEITKDFGMAKESEWGLSYKEYLGFLLLLENEQSLAMHAMNIQEASIRQNYGDTEFCLDHLITHAGVNISYVYNPVFPFLRVIDAEQRWEYSVSAEAEYGYY